jgi:hypothetical protein
MATESSAVSDLIQRIHTRRLETDPGDAYLFQSPSCARAPRARRDPVRAAVPPRMFERATPSPTQAQPAPPAPRRKGVWPLVVTLIVAGLGGTAAAMYFTTTSKHEAATGRLQSVPERAAITQVESPPASLDAPFASPAAVEPEPPTSASAIPAPVEPAATRSSTTTPAPHHRSHAKPKRVIAKHANRAASAAPRPPALSRLSRQAPDSENPL